MTTYRPGHSGSGPGPITPDGCAVELSLLTPEIRRRLGAAPNDEHDLRADAIVACLLTCLDVAGEAWTRSDGRQSLEDLVVSAVTAVRGSAPDA
jgi:hypothetical protein